MAINVYKHYFLCIMVSVCIHKAVRMELEKERSFEFDWIRFVKFSIGHGCLWKLISTI